jgi:hypothetical protein
MEISVTETCRKMETICSFVASQWAKRNSERRQNLWRFNRHKPNTNVLFIIPSHLLNFLCKYVSVENALGGQLFVPSPLYLIFTLHSCDEVRPSQSQTPSSHEATTLPQVLNIQPSIHNYNFASLNEHESIFRLHITLVRLVHGP